MKLDKEGTYYLVGDFTEEDCRKQIDKQVVAQKKEETGLGYVYSTIIKRGGAKFLRVYLVDLETWAKIPL